MQTEIVKTELWEAWEQQGYL